ncbi:RNA-directed DNA polymerase [Candidatus Saccharibacteria bacterium]|nr:RNA-directed DNA polymerase [Candidatus Saccharibacteria bacterium]
MAMVERTLAYEAKKYFMKSDNYFTVPLPAYFDFTRVLKYALNKLEEGELEDYLTGNPCEMTGVNYVIPCNKNGGFCWREFQLMHPVIYAELIKTITTEENWELLRTRSRLYRKQSAVRSASMIPWGKEKKDETAAAILKWWRGIEQESIKMALFYECMIETDVMDCYSSISLDLVRRALGNGKLGERVCELMRMMGREHSSGLPQGSMVMDFLAEMALGYTDVMVWNVLEKDGLKKDFTIIRYRDDYRIFAKDEVMARRILKILSEVLMANGLRLNSEKTVIHNDILAVARKRDKRHWDIRNGLMRLENMNREIWGKEVGWVKELSIQKWLLMIDEMARMYPNSGSVQRALVEIYEKRVMKLEHRPSDSYQLISIVADIMVTNPRTYAVGVAILCKIMSFNPGISRKCLAERIWEKARVLPNTDYLEIWLQRMTIKNRPRKKYGCKICQIVHKTGGELWNSDWLSFKMHDGEIIDHKMIKQMDYVMPVKEVQVFDGYDDEADMGMSCDDMFDDDGADLTFFKTFML